MDANETMVRLAVGADVGHGESTGCCVVLRDANGNLVENCEIKPLNVLNNAPKVYSTLTYKNDYAVIGGIQDVNVNAFFKRSPKEWDKIDPNSGKAYRTMMEDFIGKLVECLLNKDVNHPIMGNYRKEEIVLFVGCPSDETWTAPDSKAAYEELIREATGIPNVHVVAESTAAIFSIIRNNSSKNINPKDGVGVFDFGSSTADFTYVSLGKVLAEVSWTLGASAIEANIVEKVLYDEFGLDPDEVWNGDLTVRQLEARRDIKESWYGDTTSPGHVKTDPDGIQKTITYSPCDQFGNPVTTKNKAGVEKQVKNASMFTLDQAFMEDVVKTMPVCGVKTKGQLVETTNELSWYELCQKFFTKCYNLMKNKNLLCKTIILTGGASRMDFIVDICKSVFKNEVEIYRDEYPSYCVCNGLCQIAINKWRIDDVIEHEKKTVHSKADTALAIYKSDIQNKITDYIFDSIIKILKTLPDGITVAEFQKKVTAYFAANFDVQTVAELVNAPLEKMNGSVTSSVVDASLHAAAGFYSSEIDRESFAISMDMIKAIQMDGIKIGGTVINAAALAGALIKIVGEIVAIVTAGLIFWLLSAVPIIGPLIGLISYALIKDWIVNNPDRKIKDVGRTAINLNRKKDKIKKEIHDSAAKECADKIVAAQFGDGDADYHKGVDDMVDKAVRIVALEHFETTITG